MNSGDQRLLGNFNTIHLITHYVECFYVLLSELIVFIYFISSIALLGPGQWSLVSKSNLTKDVSVRLLPLLKSQRRPCRVLLPTSQTEKGIYVSLIEIRHVVNNNSLPLCSIQNWHLHSNNETNLNDNNLTERPIGS